MNGNALTRDEGFSSSREVITQAETAASAIAAQAKASVEARYIMAMQRPRDWNGVRSRLLKECSRSGFAQTALYNKPIGRGIVGLSIRFVEAALRCMTNVLPEIITVYDDDSKKIVRVTVTDLEANLTYSKDVTVTKCVERSKPMADGTYISVRKNSYDKNTYTVPATDDDILNKENALTSKAIRTLGLRLIPGDITDECELLIKTVIEKGVSTDPDQAKKAIIDGFATLNITAEMLVSYTDQAIDTLAPGQMVELRTLFATIRDGEASWKDVMDNKAQNTPENKEVEPKELPPFPQKQLDGSLQKMKNSIDDGKKSADDFINTYSTKYTLSEEQKQQIKDLEIQE